MDERWQRATSYVEQMGLDKSYASLFFEVGVYGGANSGEEEMQELMSNAYGDMATQAQILAKYILELAETELAHEQADTLVVQLLPLAA